MPLKTVLIAFVLSLSPTLGFAQGCDHSERTASSCVDGYVWNADAQKCVEQTTG